jgi:hypothetical protein
MLSTGLAWSSYTCMGNCAGCFSAGKTRGVTLMGRMMYVLLVGQTLIIDRDTIEFAMSNFSVLIDSLRVTNNSKNWGYL